MLPIGLDAISLFLRLRNQGVDRSVLDYNSLLNPPFNLSLYCYIFYSMPSKHFVPLLVTILIPLKNLWTQTWRSRPSAPSLSSRLYDNLLGLTFYLLPA